MARVPAIVGAGPQNAAGAQTFLQLVQRLKRECGVSGSGPSTVKNQVGELDRLVNWVSDAWLDLQSLHADWKFMVQPVSFVTKVAKGSYSSADVGLASLGSYKRDSFRRYLQGAPEGEMVLPYLDWDNFRDLYQFGSNRTLQRAPDVFTIDPQLNFVLGPLPDALYVVNGEAYALPTPLVNDDDTPAMPGQYHLIVVYRAMMSYGAYEGAGEVYANGEREYTRLLGRLQATQLPTLTFGPPLA